MVLCLYDKVQRVKNKWKCVLKDGVASIDGRDYLFAKCNGEFRVVIRRLSFALLALHRIAFRVSFLPSKNLKGLGPPPSHDPLLTLFST